MPWCQRRVVASARRTSRFNLQPPFESVKRIDAILDWSAPGPHIELPEIHLRRKQTVDDLERTETDGLTELEFRTNAGFITPQAELKIARIVYGEPAVLELPLVRKDRGGGYAGMGSRDQQARRRYC